VEDEGRPPGGDLEQSAREQNSNLKRLIDAVGRIITSSRELLVSLHEPRRGPREPPAENPASRDAGNEPPDDTSGSKD